MDKIWLQSYPPGVPATVDTRRFASLNAMLDDRCAEYRALPAFTNMGATLTYEDLDALSRRLAACLQSLPGLARGERVAIMLPNLLQYPVTLFGILRAGLVAVNVNPFYTRDELIHQLRDSGAKAIVVLENFAHTLQEALPATVVQHVIVARVGDLFPALKREAVNFVVAHVKHLVPEWRIPGAITFREALDRGEHLPYAPPAIGRDDVALLQYTGGTTGRAKGAVLSHANLLANIEQVYAWCASILNEGEETVVTPLPLYHVFALTANLLLFIRLGAHNILITDPRDLRHFVAELRKWRFTAITGVNTLFNALLSAPGFDEVCAASRGVLKVSVAGGMATQRAVAERWQAAMGIPLIEGYGLSESSPILCANPLDIKTFTGKLGLPLPSTEIAILDEEGRPVPNGEVGEICARGPQVMRGYWNMPEETARIFTLEGWMRTGDMGRMDDRGYVEFTDRKKDLIVVSGFKVYPTEIEDVVMQHPAVKEVGAVGLPDEKSGESIALFVVKRDPTLDEAALREYCASHLAPYKRPRLVVFRDELPKTPIGKILHRQLRDEARATLPAA